MSGELEYLLNAHGTPSVETETATWSQPAAEQAITMPGLAILATLNADGTVTVDIDANKGTVQRVAVNDKEVF